MKNKGFTLVELLVTIVVLGIVTGISIPLIRNIRNNNEDKQYTTYMDSMEYSAKLYVDSYAEDLFGHEESGCAIIKYTDLEDKSLVKDISLSDISCATEDTYVRVVKLGEKYGYAVSLGCGNKDGEGKVENITIKYPEEVISKDSCRIDAKTIMDFTTTPEKSESAKYKRRNVTLTISSATGVHTSPVIQYGFSKTQGTTVEGEWASLPITITGEKKQKELIETGAVVSIDSDQLTTPAGATGDYYLVLRIERLQDVSGREWTSDQAKSKYLYFGPFRVDNTPPTISNLKVDSTTTNYNNLTTKITLTGSDNLTATADLKMCISESNTCANYKKYENQFTYTFSGTYDGQKRTLTVYLKDLAGNIVQQKKEYTVHKDCDNLVTDNNWKDKTNCTKVCGGGKKTQESGTKDLYTSNSCSKKMSKEVDCNTQSCCSEVVYKNGTSCSKKCGTGTYNQLAYSKFDQNIRCKEKDTNTGGSKCNTQGCCSRTIEKYTGSSSGSCSVSCGGGTRTIWYYYNEISYFDNTLCGNDYYAEEVSCNENPCDTGTTTTGGTTTGGSTGGSTDKTIGSCYKGGTSCQLQTIH